MIQFSRDLLITNKNLAKTSKDANNSNLGEGFASILRVEDSRVVAKSNQVIDNEKHAFIDTPASSKQKISGNLENLLLIDCVEESGSSIIDIYENKYENEFEDGTSFENNDLINAYLYACLPFAGDENIENYTDSSNSTLINSQENEKNDVPYISDAVKHEKYTSSPASDIFAVYDGASDAECNLVDINSLLNPENPDKVAISETNRKIVIDEINDKSEISDKSVINDKSTDINIDETASLNVEEKTDSTGAELHKSSNIGINNESGIARQNTNNNDNNNSALQTDAENNISHNKLNESSYQGNADLNPNKVQESGKRNPRIVPRSAEKTSVLTTDINIIKPEDEEENIEPVNGIAVENDDADQFTVADQSVTDENNILKHDANKYVSKNHFSNNNESINKEENKPAINYFDADNGLDKDITTNRQEFHGFMNRISEQSSLLNNDPSKNVLKSTQMNLTNKGRLAFSESIGNIVRVIRTESLSKAVLIVDPPALGRVNIEIVSTDNGVEAILKVSNEHIKMLVQDNLVQLKQSLTQIGVNLTEFSVDVQHDGSHARDQSFNNYKSKKSARHGTAEGESKADKIEIFRVDLRKGLLHWIA